MRATGDLGHDVTNGRAVTDMLLQALPNTALLALSAILLAVLAGLPLGAISALKPGSWRDQAIAFLCRKDRDVIFGDVIIGFDGHAPVVFP